MRPAGWGKRHFNEARLKANRAPETYHADDLRDRRVQSEDLACDCVEVGKSVCDLIVGWVACRELGKFLA